MLSIVVPVYNEEKTIEKALDEIISYTKNAEIIVVNDGSEDSTVKKVKAYKQVVLISQPKNMGKGAAVRRGMLEAKGDFILFLDADMSTPINQLKQCLKEKTDVVIGSRALKDSVISVHQPFYREILGKTFNKLVQLFAVPGIWDTQCGFKLFSKKAAKEIFSRARLNGFSFDVEALYLARRLGFKIREVPVVWIDNPDSTVHPVKDSLRMFRDIFRIHWYSLTGKYGKC